jgi:hypothetical protein
MSSVSTFFASHMWAIIGTFITQYVWSAFIGALPAPTVTSSSMYQFFFKFLNLLAANIARATSTRTENSPNWSDAVQKATGGANAPLKP